MEEKLKAIVAGFIKLAPQQIAADTPIDRRAVQSSIHLHRMYARLAEEGIATNDYSRIKVFGDLLRAASPGGATAVIPSDTTSTGATVTTATAASTGLSTVAYGANIAGIAATSNGAATAAIGIDIEETLAMPRVNDFRTEEFYKMNFTPEEIAHCILQRDPYASFTGLFAAKEAIVKASGLASAVPFNTIRITHSPEGKPLHAEFQLSISHTGQLAVAVAVKAGGSTVSQWVPPASPVLPPVSTTNRSIAWLALALGILALVITLATRL